MTTLAEELQVTIDAIASARKAMPEIDSITLNGVSVRFREAPVDTTKPIPVIDANVKVAEALRAASGATDQKLVKGGRYDGIPESDLFSAVEGVR